MTSSSDVPIEFQIWTAGRCAEYFGITSDNFLREIRYAKNFPAPLPFTAGRQPRWGAKAVIEWALDRRIPETTTRAGSQK